MQVIIPMAWIWRRFKDKWYKIDKYLLEIQWKTIIEKIIGNFDLENDNYIFICNEYDSKLYNLHDFFSKLNIKYRIVLIDNHNLWPVYSLSKAEKYILDESDTIVNYCDFYWRWDYKDFKNKVKYYDWSIICYKWFHPHLMRSNLYAWVLTNSKNELIEIKEKFSYTQDKRDTWQSSWTYYFKNWIILKKYIQELINANIKCNDEFYVSLMYNLLKKDWLKTYIYEIPYFLQLWTPDDYEEYKYRETIFSPTN